MLSEQDRMSLREIEDRLRESDADLVRAFDILTPISAGSPLSGPVSAPMPRPDRLLLRGVQLLLATAMLLSVVLTGLAAQAGDGATLLLCAAFGALVGLACYVAAAVVRPRR